MNILINWLNGNEGVIASFNLITTIITCFIFLGILSLTIIYAGSTVYLAYKTSKSVEITKEKDKTDRAILYIDKFNGSVRKSFLNLMSKKKELTNHNRIIINLNDASTWYEIRDVIVFFNFLSLLINEDKVDFDLVNRGLLGNYMLSFLILLLGEMEGIIKRFNIGAVKRYSFKDYFEVCLKIDKEICHLERKEKDRIRKFINEYN